MNKEWSELNKSMQAQIKKKDSWPDEIWNNKLRIKTC